MKAPFAIALSLLLSGALLCRAETVTIALTGTSSAEVTEEDAPASITVSYQQTGGNGKGWFTANSAADLVLTGMPSGTVTSVLVYMRSNQKAGAGQVLLTLGNLQLLSFNGSFADWRGTGYSTSYLPFAAVGAWRVGPSDVMQLHITATENSLYLGQVEIEYTPDPPVIQCSEFRWLDTHLLRQIVLCEDVAGEGILLPDVDDEARTVMRDGQTYRFLGWTDRPVENASAPPFTRLPHSRYYITSPDAVFFALYKLQTNMLIGTRNDLSDGEYALALNTGDGEMALAAGRVKDGTVPTILAPLQRDAAGYAVWNTTSASDAVRYSLTVREDSVILFHPASHSYLGYNNSGSLSPYERAWAWQAVGKGTVMLYHNSTNSSSKRGLTVKESGSDYVIGEKAVMWSEDTECVFAFPLAGVPVSETAACYTTFPSLTPLEEIIIPSATRKELRNGQIVIRTPQATYNLLGMPVR